MADEEGQVRNDELDAEARARRQLALARIRQWGDPALRLPAREVETFDADLGRLVEQMTSLMRDARGVGLAANQVGVLRRVFVFQPDEEQDPVAVVNPRLEGHGDELETAGEGCLSLQGVTVPVERHAAIVLAGQDLRGAPLRLEVDGLGARVAQHELDHLDAVLILDRTTHEARREALGILRPRPVLAVAR
ncbi:MAG: peptide deformylase [Gaiellaceae bacterium]